MHIVFLLDIETGGNHRHRQLQLLFQICSRAVHGQIDTVEARALE